MTKKELIDEIDRRNQIIGSYLFLMSESERERVEAEAKVEHALAFERLMRPLMGSITTHLEFALDCRKTSYKRHRDPRAVNSVIELLESLRLVSGYS